MISIEYLASDDYGTIHIVKNGVIEVTIKTYDINNSPLVNKIIELIKEEFKDENKRTDKLSE